MEEGGVAGSEEGAGGTGELLHVAAAAIGAAGGGGAGHLNPHLQPTHHLPRRFIRLLPDVYLRPPRYWSPYNQCITTTCVAAPHLLHAGSPGPLPPSTSRSYYLVTTQRCKASRLQRQHPAVRPIFLQFVVNTTQGLQGEGRGAPFRGAPCAPVHWQSCCALCSRRQQPCQHPKQQCPRLHREECDTNS